MFGGRSSAIFSGAPGLFFAAGQILHRIDRHAVFVGHDAANPRRRRHLVFRVADPFADQILRFADAAVRC